ncbi:hypothetical protein M404DRAFT_993487, partial [Pisolithus tinctorius Marx 270]
ARRGGVRRATSAVKTAMLPSTVRRRGSQDVGQCYVGREEEGGISVLGMASTVAMRWGNMRGGRRGRRGN